MALSNADDDLDFNPFYKILQKMFRAEYEEAQAKCYMICVPHSSSIQGMHFNKHFVDMHIVRPSPYFKGVYVTTDKNGTGSLSLERNILETGQGFPDKRSVRIMAEELGYNKAYQPYRVLLIDRPLTGQVAAPTGKETLCSDLSMYEPKTSLSECVSFLESIPECRQVVHTDLEQAISSFDKNYVVLRAFLADVADKIKTMHTDMSQKVLQSLPANLSDDQRISDNVYRAVESIILSRLHSRIFPVICDECRQNDAELEVKVEQLRRTSHEKLRFDERFQCAQPTAVSELSRFCSLTTPLEKMACMRKTLCGIQSFGPFGPLKAFTLHPHQTIHSHMSTAVYNQDAITATLDTHLSQQLNHKLSGLSAIVTSDDLISLLVSVIIQCRDLRLPSHIFFIDHFHWTSSAVDSISYCFVTFKAAVQVLLSLDVSQGQMSSRSRQQDSAETSSVDYEIDIEALPGLVDPSLSVMTRRVELSTREFEEANKMSTPPGLPRVRNRNHMSEERRKHLGDFLSSLQDDGCSSSYGKQT